MQHPAEVLKAEILARDGHMEDSEEDKTIYHGRGESLPGYVIGILRGYYSMGLFPKTLMAYHSRKAPGTAYFRRMAMDTARVLC